VPPQLPPVGTRISLRYRLPPGSTPPLTDVVGHLVTAGPTLVVRTKRGDQVSVAITDVVAVKALSDAPVRTSDIRNCEHAAAAAWPGRHRSWLDGWLLRAADGYTHRGNSAVPLGIDAGPDALPAVVDWYAARGLTPWLAVPDRLLPVPDSARPEIESLMLTRGLAPGGHVEPAVLSARPDRRWLELYQRDVPVDVLCAVVDGEVTFGRIGDVAVGRAAVTTAPDGTRWLGMSAVRVADDQRRRGHARALCAALLAWGAERAATRAYVQVVADNAGALALYESMGFTLQHRERYYDARTFLPAR
jgi:GNAT superfamily N-acetyltransferase